MRPVWSLALLLATLCVACSTAGASADAATTTTTTTASTADGAPDAATRLALQTAATTQMATELGCRGLKPAAAEIVRTHTAGDVVTAETLIAGCGELKRYTVRCTRGADCDVGPAGDPFAAVSAAALDAARKNTGCAEVEVGRLKDSADRTVDGVAVRSAVVKVRGCGSIWNYATTCTGDACESHDVDAPATAATPTDPDLDVGAIADLGDVNLSDADAAGPVE